MLSIMGRRRSRWTQLELQARGSWGGWRQGSGRKRLDHRTTVDRGSRPHLSGRHPVHVTLRVRDEAPRLRRHRVYDVLRGAFRTGKDRFGFRLNHYSIQSNHIHLVCEADDKRALSRGMQGLAIRIARRLNKAHGRRGKLFADRYHMRILETPTEVRRVLVYVLRNTVHHGKDSLAGPVFDVFSSAALFRGWREKVTLPVIDNEADDGPLVMPPRVWLLSTGWMRAGGPISFDEEPARGERT